MGFTTESDEADSVMLRKPAEVSADPLSALFPPLTEKQAEEYAKYLGPAAPDERTWGVWTGIRNLNEQGQDPTAPEDIAPKPAAEIGLWFKF